MKERWNRAFGEPYRAYKARVEAFGFPDALNDAYAPNPSSRGSTLLARSLALGAHARCSRLQERWRATRQKVRVRAQVSWKCQFFFPDSSLMSTSNAEQQADHMRKQAIVIDDVTEREDKKRAGEIDHRLEANGSLRMPCS
jgi:hypothetical protein